MTTAVRMGNLTKSSIEATGPIPSISSKLSIRGTTLYRCATPQPCPKALACNPSRSPRPYAFLARAGLWPLVAYPPRRAARHPAPCPQAGQNRSFLRRGPILDLVSRSRLRLFLEAAPDRLDNPPRHRGVR